MENKNNANFGNNNNVNKGGNGDKLSLYYSIGAVVVIIFIIIWSMNSKGGALVGNLGQDKDQKIEIPTEDTSAGSVNVVKKVPSISYADALVKYKDARIQFDDKCQSFPNNVTYKNGTYVMLDNRASVARKIKIGTTYDVKGYGFKIIKLSSSTLPATFLVDCDQYENVATILIQK